MFLVAFNRSIWFALQSFWRNIWLSLATIFIIFLTFVSINSLVILSALSDSAIEAVKQKVDISLHFHQNVRENKVAEIKSHLEALPQVQAISYYSPDQNLQIFKDRYQNDSLIQETLSELEGNPLGAILIIKAKQLSDYPEILGAIDNPAYSDLIEEKSYEDHQAVIANINTITDNVGRVGFIISVIFVLIAVLIVFNTVRIAIFTHRSEIAIMKLVGATNWFIRSPFIIESLLSGIIALILAMALIYPALSFIQPHLNTFFEGANFNLIGYVNEHFIIIFGLQFVGIIILNTMASALALGKYLRV